MPERAERALDIWGRETPGSALPPPRHSKRMPLLLWQEESTLGANVMRCFAAKNVRFAHCGRGRPRSYSFRGAKSLLSIVTLCFTDFRVVTTSPFAGLLFICKNGTITPSTGR